MPSFFNVLAEVAIVLLVGPVELEDSRGVFAEMRLAVVELVGHVGLEVLAGQLDRLDLLGLAPHPVWSAPSAAIAFCALVWLSADLDDVAVNRS